MARITNLKRIVKEDFPEDQQNLVEKLAFALNPFLEQISNAFNKNIGFENLTREVINITIENSSGNLKAPAQLRTTLSGRILGINIIKAENLTNLSTYPIQAPWISWTYSGNIITINKVTGIQDDNKYRLTLEIIS